ncbi:hypothetical protein CCR75_000348 [Bremia lactucae]|uniref:Methyltransferase type 11 domain-containing protein n=1 Tax=Bremia lactucae TaxID=4779 RepID=A0A976FPD1_BRELC|nr:hypothetical protein CCR75_000348 [Bremia lactucae]
MKAQNVRLIDSGTAPYTLAYFTSAWVQSADALVLPRLRLILGGISALCLQQPLIELVEIRRIGEDEDLGDSNNTKGQKLEPVIFRSLCKHYNVKALPACVLMGAQGQALTLESLALLENEICQKYCLSTEDMAESPCMMSTGNLLCQLLRSHGVSVVACEALRPFWRLRDACENAKTFNFLKVDDPVLVHMRNEALQLYETGQFYSALSMFVRVLLHCPTCPKANFNLAVILHTIGETYFAVASMLRVVTLDDSDSVAHTVLRSVYYQEEPDLVVSGYKTIITANRDSHVRAVHALATLNGATSIKKAAPAYVAKVFDELADCFEEKVIAHLKYRVPWQLVKALTLVSPPGFPSKYSTAAPEWIVADVGCGTGLCGRLLRPHVKYLIGVDISPLMIKKTRDEGNYDELHTADIVPFLESCEDNSLDLLISADVWIYVGALEEVFELCARKLRLSTGWMAFSIELLPIEYASDETTELLAGFRLANSGRFQHSHEYIMNLVCRWGFDVAIQQDVRVRKESGEPIPGRIYLLQHQEKKI